MPAIIIAILRQIVMSIVTGAIVTSAQEALDGTIKELVFEIKDKQGLTEQDAKDVVHNILVDMAINSAAILVGLRLKLPTKTAQYLGLTTSSPKKKALTAAATAATSALTKNGGKAVAVGMLPELLKIFKNPMTYFWAYLGWTQAIEPGIYQPKQANDVYQKFTGLRPFPEKDIALQPGPFDAAGFNEYAKSLEIAGIKGIENPVALQSQYYSREGLADIVNYVYGQEVLKGNALTKAKLIPLLARYLIGVGSVKSTTSGVTTSTSQSSYIPTVKVFTGVVSQGVVGQGLSFTARPDDLIENVAELKAAAANNLAPFLAALPAKVTYEIKVVSSIITANGFRQTGTTQRVQTGTNRDGSPKYKTVTNKFAVLYLYILSDRGTRTKLSTVVLGPVDSARFVMTSSDLTTLALELPKIVTTNSTDEIAKIVSTTPTEVVQVKDPTAPNISTKRLGELQYYKVSTNGIDSYHVLPWGGNVPFGFSPITKAEYIAGTPKGEVPRGSDINFGTGIFAANYIDPQFARFQAYAPTPSEQYYTESFFNTLDKKEQDRIKALYPNYSFAYDAKELANTGSAGSTDGTNSTKAGATASTLSEWYQAQGKSLPSVQERSLTYQQLGLGQSSYYTGTAEQNTKLLLALKG